MNEQFDTMKIVLKSILEHCICNEFFKFVILKIMPFT